jgi:SulP family sulfate permease
MLSRDLFAGLTIAVIALPLAIAFAIGAGATPFQGLWTAIIAGAAIAILGGSRYQVSGPTGAFVVIIAGVITRHGMEGLILATLLAGLLLIIIGISGLGTLIKFMPYPVIIGFTTGIGLVIAGGQLRDVFGLTIPHYGSEFHERIVQVALHLGSINPWAFALGLATMLIILAIRRFIPKLPAAIMAIIAGSLVAWLLKLPVETIGSRFGDVPSGLPRFSVAGFNLEMVRAVFPSAITIALLGAIESLLSAVVADGMTGDRHDSGMELVAQGTGNILSALFGGIPATGAIARTAANIKNGAASPVAALVHALILLVFTLFAARVVSIIPLAVLSGILLIVAWDMSELRRFTTMVKAPKSDFLVMLVTFVLTVAVDLTVAVEFGMLLAMLLFMKRIHETSAIRPIMDMLDADDSAVVNGNGTILSSRDLPVGLELYEINGPFFFGTAGLLQDVLDRLKRPPVVFILRMRRVPSVDATGLNALESFRQHCVRHGTILILSGVREQPAAALAKSGLTDRIGPVNICASIDLAMTRAQAVLAAVQATRG